MNESNNNGKAHICTHIYMHIYMCVCAYLLVNESNNTGKANIGKKLKL